MINHAGAAATNSTKAGVNWRNALFLTLTPLASAILVPIYFAHHGWSWGLAAFFFVSYAISNMTITCGYHRCFSHRSYEAHPLIQFLYIFVGAGAFQGSVLEWCSDHRQHHRAVDTPADPYCIKKGFWYAHMGWLLRQEQAGPKNQLAPDLAKNNWIAWQHRHYGALATVIGFVLPAGLGWALGFGWGGFIFGGLLRVVCSQHSTFFINSLCHTLGRQPYSDRHTARDSIVMAFLTFGEGYHNYHHQFQADYRNGVRWYQWDPTKWSIEALRLLGLARRLKQVSKEEILKARLAMDERLMLARGASADRLLALKARITEAQAKIRQLRADYREMKRAFRARARSAAATTWNRERLREEIRSAKTEFKAARRQWQAYASALRSEAV
jgi:stearoyl-CoA desaturase (delta-9 desaturase)